MILLVLSIVLLILTEKFSNRVNPHVRTGVHKFFMINLLYYFTRLSMFLAYPLAPINNTVFIGTYIGAEVIVYILKQKDLVNAFFSVPETHPAYEVRHGLYTFLNKYGLLNDAIIAFIWLQLYFVSALVLF